MNSIDFYIKQMRELENIHARSSGLQQMRQKQLEEVQKNGYFVMKSPPQNDAKNLHISLHPRPENVNPKMLLHKHTFYELMYVYRGSCVNHFNENTITIQEGEMLLLNPNTAHCPETLTDQDCVFNIMFRQDFFQYSLDLLLKDNTLFSSFFMECMFQSSIARDYLFFLPGKASADTMERLIVECFEKQSCYETITQSLLVELFAYLARNSDNSFSYPKNNHERLILKIITYIQESPAEITLQKVSEQFQYSTAYLSRMIKQYTGKNFSEIVRDCRLTKAKYCLESSSLLILDIALMLGYNDISHFYKVFKQEIGCTPTEYRKHYSH